jgi:hypothetical protein
VLAVGEYLLASTYKISTVAVNVTGIAPARDGGPATGRELLSHPVRFPPRE